MVGVLHEKEKEFVAAHYHFMGLPNDEKSLMKKATYASVTDHTKKSLQLRHFMPVGYSVGRACAHAHKGDTVASVQVGGLRTVINGAYEVQTGDQIQMYIPEAECSMFNENGGRIECMNIEDIRTAVGAGPAHTMDKTSKQRRDFYNRGLGVKQGSSDRVKTGPPSTEYDPSLRNRRERDQRAEFDTGLGDFFDPPVDQHSAFYFAMERDKHAAHLVAGTSFLDLNNVILKTECNNAYKSMNEEDMQKLRKLMWDVYVPHIQQQMEQRVLDKENATESFQAQMYVVHLSVRVAQALQLVFELNQKKSFSAVVKTAYEMALQDVLYHPSLKGKIKSSQYKELVNYLRRHETYSTAFNTYVGYKLLRQQLVRSGGAGTNRKSNDAERLHDEAANRLWGVLEENRGLFDDFTNALKPYTMEWHTLYYKEIAETLFHKLADHHVSSKHGTTHHMSGTERDGLRNSAEEMLKGPQEGTQVQAFHSAPGSPYGTDSTTAGISTTGGNSWGTNITTGGKSSTRGNSGSGGSSSTFLASGVDNVSAFQETRDAVAGGTSKRSSATVTNPILSMSPFNSPAAKRQRGVVDDANSTQIIGGVVSTPAPRVRGAFGSLFK
ncbi:hypothetical protein T484DRAFT_1756034 [Baffinella frigidus]|nr:hypothetical protein T484DRAFT_1756034 [Cryptophyta sp. CCMP2293]